MDRNPHIEVEMLQKLVKTLQNLQPPWKKSCFFLKPLPSLIPKSLVYQKMIGFGPNFRIWGFDFPRIEFYKLLASSLHPAGAFSPIKATFLSIFNMPHISFHGFCEYLGCLQALGQQGASRRGFFPTENCIPGNFKHGRPN